MTEQAHDDLKAIADRLGPGMSLDLDCAAFARFFGSGQIGRDAAGAFATQEGCLAIVKEEGRELSARLLRAYPRRHDK